MPSMHRAPHSSILTSQTGSPKDARGRAGPRIQERTGRKPPGAGMSTTSSWWTTSASFHVMAKSKYTLIQVQMGTYRFQAQMMHFMGEILSYKWCQQIQERENVKGPPPRPPPLSGTPPTQTHAHGPVRISVFPQLHPGLHFLPCSCTKSHVFVPCSLPLRGEPFSCSLYKGLCNPRGT